jgi:NAD-dependent SIR2 family protein deacetylase
MDNSTEDHERVISRDGFLKAIQERIDIRRESPFCFVLGAGASQASGIPTAQTFARKWVDELYERDPKKGDSIESWKKTNPRHGESRT